MKMIHLNLIPNSRIDLSDKCDICVQSKKLKKSFNSVSRTSTLLEFIHSAVCELNGVLIRGGKRYITIFIDDFSRYYHIYLLKPKDEAFSEFYLFKLKVENQTERKLKG